MEAAYGPRKGSALRPPIEPMRTTRPPPPPQRGQERLHHGDLADDVHLELAAELVERDELERSRDRDPGVRDEPVQLGADDRGGRRDLLGVRDVELDRLDASSPQRVRVFRGANAPVDAPASPAQTERARTADPRRGTRDEDGLRRAQSARFFERSSESARSDFPSVSEPHSAEDAVRLRELDVAVVDDLPVVPPRVEEVVRADHAHACLARPADDFRLVVHDEPVVPRRDRLGGPLERDELVAEVDERHSSTPAAQLHPVDEAPEEVEHLVEISDLDGDVVDPDEPGHVLPNDPATPEIPPRRRRARRSSPQRRPCPARSPTPAPSGTPGRR